MNFIFKFFLIVSVVFINLDKTFSVYDFCDFGECDSNEIYNKCLHSTKFSAKELDLVKQYIQRKFAKTHPLKPPCKRLRVRKDIKCLSEREIYDLVNAFKQLYANGVMDRYALIHGTYWGAIHKFSEAVPWHRWLMNEVEKDLRNVNPKISMPYWEWFADFAAPEKSKIWQIFGSAGPQYDGYCVSDGALGHIRLKYPKPHCLKRQWNSNGTVPPWEPPEWITSIAQTSRTWADFAGRLGYSGHFKIHLHVGGYEGDISGYYSNNDPVFYPFHTHLADLAILKWQLSDDQNLLPLSYNEGPAFNVKTNEITRADIESDSLTYFEDTTVKEAFQVGYGDLCYIHDQLVRPILNIIHKKKPKLPKIVRNLKKSLPNEVFSQYYPKFAENTAKVFDNFMPEILSKYGKHSSYPTHCDGNPVALSYNSTPNGRRLIKILKTDTYLDVTPEAFAAEQEYYDFIDVVNKNNYCSPYV